MAKFNMTNMNIKDKLLAGYKAMCKREGRSVKAQTIKLIEDAGERYLKNNAIEEDYEI